MPLVYYTPVAGFRIGGEAINYKGHAFAAGRGTEVREGIVSELIHLPIFSLHAPAEPDEAAGALFPVPEAAPKKKRGRPRPAWRDAVKRNDAR